VKSKLGRSSAFSSSIGSSFTSAAAALGSLPFAGAAALAGALPPFSVVAA